MAKAKAKGKRGRPAQGMTRTSVFFREDQLASLATVNQRTGVPVATLIRSGVDRELAARGVKSKGEGR
jgi:hypothetical protein